MGYICALIVFCVEQCGCWVHYMVHYMAMAGLEVSIIVRDIRGLVSYAIMLCTFKLVVVVLGDTNHGLCL